MEHSVNQDTVKVVSTSDGQVLVHAMCNCGDDDCAYTYSFTQRSMFNNREHLKG